VHEVLAPRGGRPPVMGSSSMSTQQMSRMWTGNRRNLLYMKAGSNRLFRGHPRRQIFFNRSDCDPTVRNTPQSITFSFLPEPSSRSFSCRRQSCYTCYLPSLKPTDTAPPRWCMSFHREVHLSAPPSSKAFSVSSSPLRFFDVARRQRKQRVTFFFLCHNPGEPLAPRNPINSESSRETGRE
jgi:hypothetical protein